MLSPVSFSFENKEGGDITSQSWLKCLMQISEQLELVKVCVLILVSSLGRGGC